MGIDDQIMPRVGEFNKYIFQLSFLTFPIMKGHLKTTIMDIFILELNS